MRASDTCCAEATVAGGMADDTEIALREAGLRHVDDSTPGITRVRRGSGFSYVDPKGNRVRDAATLARIATLAIPPAYEAVWICPDPSGHLQATGRDARGRKQYVYHPDWGALRDTDKYGRLAEFGTILPRLRARVERDLRAMACRAKKWPQPWCGCWTPRSCASARRAMRGRTAPTA